KQQRHSIAEKLALLGVADLADELDQGVLQKRRNLVRKIIAVDGIDLRGDLQRDSGLAGNRDGPVGPFFRSDPAEKSEIAAGAAAETMQVARQTVQHRPVPIGPRKRRLLRGRD